MTTRTVVGNIRSLTDSAVATGTVTFEKLVTSATGSTIHQSGVTTATTDGSGDFSIALAVPASGSYRYRMILPNGASFYFSIASGASVNVATLIVAETITDSDAIVEALAAYLPLSGGTLTGQLNFSGTTHAGIKLLSLTTAQRDALTPANGMVIYNSTTATGQVYQGGAWASVGGGGGASDVTDLTTTGGNVAEMLNVKAGGGLQYRTVAQVLSDLRDSGALATPDLGVTVQGYSAKTAAIAALAWAANSILLLTGTATASVQALAAHIVTLLQSASAADARTAIGAGTGNGDLLAANNLSELTATASTARSNIGAGTGDGDVTAAAAFATDNRAIRADGTGKGVQYSTVLLDDNGGLTLGPGSASTTSRVITFIGSTGTTLGYIDVAAGILRFVGVTNTAIFADNAEVVRIANTSRVGIGRTSPEGKLHVYDSGGGFMQCYKSGVVGSATAVLPDAAGDVTLCLSGTFTISDGAGNTAGGVITKTAPGGTFNLYDDGGTNTCQLQISAGGAVTVIRTAGSRTYAVNLQLNWM